MQENHLDSEVRQSFHPALFRCPRKKGTNPWAFEGGIGGDWLPSASLV